MIAERPEFWRAFITEHVDIVAMNEEEGEALTGAADPLLACERALELTDLVLCTAGPTGLYLAGHTDDESSARRAIRSCPARSPSSTATSSAGRWRGRGARRR